MSDRKPSATLAIICGLAAIALLTGMDALIKALSPHVSTIQIMLLRAAASIAWIVPYMLVARIAPPSRDTFPGHARRVALMIIANAAFFYALGKLPLAEVFALNFIAPIFIAIFGVIFLGESWGRNTVIGIVLGAVGMMAILSPQLTSFGHSGAPLDGYIAAVVAPVVYAAAVVMLRSQAKSEHPAQIALAQMTMITAVMLPLTAATGWSPLPPIHWATVAAIGFLSAAGYLLLVKALSVITAVRYAAIEYTGLIWAAAIGYVFFSEIPPPALWFGAVLIMLGALAATVSRQK